jgi:lysylphosphatidylglycerol synthetase-like protein (DUF2156 family)
VDAALNLKAGGVCLIVGAVVFAIWRLLHGDTPAAEAEAALNFVRNRPIYPTVHVFAVLAALVVVIGLLGLTRSFDRPGSWLFGQAAVVSAMVGLAIFGVESTSEGLALPELADAASKVDPAQRVEFVRAAHAVAAATHGPSLVAMALMIGVPILLLGIAMVLDRYPSWLGWTGLVIGGITMLAAVGLPHPHPVSRLPPVRGVGLGYRAAMAGGDGDRDAAACSRSTGHGHDRVREPRRPPPRWPVRDWRCHRSSH